MRPPGHHAEKIKRWVFVSITIVQLLLIIHEKYKYKNCNFDPDVHHGNGTQDIFFDNKNVLYLSTHQYPFYPGTGSEKEKGKHNNIFNVLFLLGLHQRNI